MQIRLTVIALAVATAFPAFSQSTVTTGEAVMATTVVTATRQVQRVDEVLASVDVITREEIERAGNRTLVELLASRPGVQVTSNGGAGASSSVFIRGANSSHTLLLIDGVRIGSATIGAPTLETIPLALVERIEILRGPSSALYGADAIGGVIQIFTRRDTTTLVPRLHFGAGTWDTYTASAGVSGLLDRLRFSLDVGHDRSRGFDAVPESDAGTDADRDGWRNDYVNASVGFGFRERDEIGLSYWATDGRNWYDNALDFNSFIDKRSEIVGLHMLNEVSEGWFSTLRYAETGDKTRNRASNVAPTRFDTTQRQLTWQNDIDLAGGSLMLAYERLSQIVDGTTAYDVRRRTVNSWLGGWGGSFDRHNLQFNLRRDRNSQFGSRNTGTVAYGYAVTDKLQMVASVGNAFRAPSFNQLYFPGFGEPDLKPEKALNRELGLRWKDGRHGLEVTYFNTRVRDLIGGFPIANIDTAKLKGLELAGQTRIGRFDLAAGFDWLNARDDETKNWLPRRARHSGYLRVDTLAGDWRLGAEVTGQGKRYNDAGNNQKLSAYTLLHLYADYEITPDWRLELRANNVLDEKYRLAQDFFGRNYAAPRANVFVGVRYTPR